MTGRGEDDLDDAADMSDPPATDALRDPPDSDTGEIRGTARETAKVRKKAIEKRKGISLARIINL